MTSWQEFLALKVDPDRVLKLLLDLLVGGFIIWWAHGHLEAELARPERSAWSIGIWAAVLVTGVLAVPSFRGRVLPAAKEGLALFREGRDAVKPS
jgi:hypothetical protein